MLYINVGTIGDKFYILIEGTVSVMLPNPDLKDFKKRYDDLLRKKYEEEQERLE